MKYVLTTIPQETTSGLTHMVNTEADNMTGQLTVLNDMLSSVTLYSYTGDYLHLYWQSHYIFLLYILESYLDGLVQERHNSSGGTSFLQQPTDLSSIPCLT